MESTVQDDDEGRRLDRVLRRVLPELPLSALHRLVRQGEILLDGQRARGDTRLRSGEVISIPSHLVASKPVTSQSNKPVSPMATKNLPPILYEGQGLLVFSKSPGMAVHGPRKGNLTELALPYLTEKIPPSLSFRPGPLHRLDTMTSGLIVFSANLQGARTFSALMREGRITKTYLALVEGKVEGNHTWEDRLYRDSGLEKTVAGPGQAAQSQVRGLGCGGGYSLIEVELLTGRTHQIRAQSALRGHALGGDQKYGGKPLPEPLGRKKHYFLHSYRMELPLDPPLLLEAPIPEDFLTTIKQLIGKTSIPQSWN